MIEFPLSWPVIRLTQPSTMIVRFDSEEELLTARYIGVEDLQKLDSVIVLDSQGTGIVLKRPRLEKDEIGVVKRIVLSIVNPEVRIVYDDVEMDESLDLEWLKEQVEENIQKYREYWLEMDVDSVDSLLSRVRAAQEIREIVDLVEF